MYVCMYVCVTCKRTFACACVRACVCPSVRACVCVCVSQSQKLPLENKNIDVRTKMSELRSRKLEVGTRNLEVGSWKLEVGTKKSEVRSPYPAFVGIETGRFSRLKLKKGSVSSLTVVTLRMRNISL